MYQDGARRGATKDTVDGWISAFHCNYDVVIDPKASCRPPSGSIGLPYHVIVNPRDMTVYAIAQGAGATLDAKVKELIALNKK